MNSTLQRPVVGGVGSPRGLSKSTFVTVSLVAVVSLVYATCVPGPRVRIIVFVPPILDLREYTNDLLFHDHHPVRASTASKTFYLVIDRKEVNHKCDFRMWGHTSALT